MGSDVAELLMRDSSSLGACGVSGEPADGETLIDLSETPTPEKENLNIADLLTGYPPTDKEEALESCKWIFGVMLYFWPAKWTADPSRRC